MSVRFCPLASGSSGNSVYISDGETNLLIDAGLSGVSIERALANISDEPIKIDAILITHEHSDHISGAGILSRRFNAPIFATPGTWAATDRNKLLGKITVENRRFVYPGTPFSYGAFTINAFDIPHDASQPVGYSFNVGGYKLALATDIGEATDKIKEQLIDSDVILIESNHDVEMLKNGRYPQHLKKRILSERGHLSNVNAGLLLCDIFTSKLKHVFLGHLSDENNRPMIAFDTVCRILIANDIKINCENGFRISVADRFAASTMIELA